MDPSGLFEALTNGISKLPSALIAAALLGGPTAIWLVIRFTNPSDVAKRDEVVLENLLWICASCRSINEDRLSHCYRCHRTRAVESVPLIIDARPRSGAGVGIPVGPGLPGQSQTANTWLGLEPPAPTLPADAAATPDPIVVKPRVKVSSRENKAVAGPAGRRGRSKPQGAGEANKNGKSRKPGS